VTDIDFIYLCQGLFFVVYFYTIRLNLSKNISRISTLGKAIEKILLSKHFAIDCENVTLCYDFAM
jgi:hypothetical protein